jgi:hypothetical protein
MAKSSTSGAILRCAIYTRKSLEEGLEQDFYSLQAQREACEAYIRIQKHEGWSLLSTNYDDGGYSGGTLQRPALERLLTDIRARKVNVVVVYKIDRLTRSLFDFAKLVEVFDAGLRLPATEIEAAVAIAVIDLLGDQQRLFELLAEDKPHLAEPEQLLKMAEKLKSHLQTLSPEEQRMRLEPLLQKIVVGAQEFVLTLRLDRLIGLIVGGLKQTAVGNKNAVKCELFDLTVPLNFRRRGRELRLVLPNVQHANARIDQTLIGLVSRGYRWRHEIVHGTSSSATEIAKRENGTDAYVCRLMRLSFLAPEFLEAIVRESSTNLSLRRLLSLPSPPLDWPSQKEMLGIQDPDYETSKKVKQLRVACSAIETLEA